MAISIEQLEYAKSHFTTLLPDLLVFPEKHETLDQSEIYGVHYKHPFIDTKAILSGEFDLLTTVESIWGAFCHYELVSAQMNRHDIHKPSQDLLNSVSTFSVENAYLNTLDTLVKHRSLYQTIDMSITPEPNSTARMRPTLFHQL